MTFNKHNWNQLSESSQNELKRRQAYQQGYQQGLNEQGGVPSGFNPLGRPAPQQWPGYPGPPQGRPEGWPEAWEEKPIGPALDPQYGTDPDMGYPMNDRTGYYDANGNWVWNWEGLGSPGGMQMEHTMNTLNEDTPPPPPAPPAEPEGWAGGYDAWVNYYYQNVHWQGGTWPVGYWGFCWSGWCWNNQDGTWHQIHIPPQPPENQWGTSAKMPYKPKPPRLYPDNPQGGGGQGP